MHRGPGGGRAPKKEESTKEAQGEGHAITLKLERPPIVGEKVANWDGQTLGSAKKVEAEAAPQPLQRYDGESVRSFNRRLANEYNFDSVEALFKVFPALKELAKQPTIPPPDLVKGAKASGSALARSLMGAS